MSSLSEKVLNSSVSVLGRAESGGNLDDLLDEFHNDQLRSICADLLFNYFRNKAFIDYLISLFTQKNRKKTPAKYKRIIAVALTQSLFQTGIDSFVAVDLAVSYAKKKYGKKIAGFINAVLRRCLDSDINEIKSKMPKYIKLNIPAEILARWKKHFSNEEIHSLGETFSCKPMLTFRLSACIPEEELTEFKCIKMTLPEWAEEYSFYCVEDPKTVFSREWLKNGQIYIQDPSTVSPCSLLKCTGDELIIDLCSAPGGKSLLFYERIKQGCLIASDKSLKRQQRTIENFQKVNTERSHIVVASALNTPFRTCSADIVLLDVPCTNTGVVRRRPDVLWNFTMQKLNELTEIQKEILGCAAVLVKPGGSIIYSTCSIEKEENSRQIEIFLKKHSEFSLEKERQLLPNQIHDGGYSALLRRTLIQKESKLK